MYKIHREKREKSNRYTVFSMVLGRTFTVSTESPRPYNFLFDIKIFLITSLYIKCMVREVGKFRILSY